MIYKFKDLFGEWSSDKDTCVVFITGRYTVFNDIAIKLLRNSYKGDETGLDDITNTDNSYSDFGVRGKQSELEASVNSVPIANFFDVVGIYSIMGRWYCQENIKVLTKNQKEKIMNYIKKPDRNGLLVIVSEDWRDYNNLLKSRVLQNSKKSHIINLSFPTRAILEEVVRNKFRDSSLHVSDGAVDVFISKMGMAYEEYDTEIDRISSEAKIQGNSIDRADMIKYMKGIEHFAINDFIRELADIKYTKKRRNKAMTIASYLIEEYGYRNFIYKAIKEIDKMIQYRIWIDMGLIPIGIKYFFKDVIRRIGLDENKVIEQRFRREAYVASLTTLKDWQCIKVILSNAVGYRGQNTKESEIKLSRAILDICTRGEIGESRINNILEIDNTIENPISRIDKIEYKESHT